MTTNKQSTIIQINSNGMGEADGKLKQTLVTNYFTILNNENYLPAAIIFYAEGVKLLCRNSPVLEPLQELENKSVKVLACKTCLNYYNLIDQMEVGIIATMIDIIDLQFTAEKVINL